jgi:hypothetical protein
VVGLYSIVVLTVGRFVRLQFANLMMLIVRAAHRVCAGPELAC